ncbi:hypothetical protein E2C01_099376 [Portunus trituberculatus]|uniref:Uncharacterized protein n=1 Tax=Portunus trituberculatus TaxID=210409 RepID=A0A5B7KA72_PORTR|nr:hypothetical protein [Portunus trituberculatus]
MCSYVCVCMAVKFVIYYFFMLWPIAPIDILEEYKKRCSASTH